MDRSSTMSCNLLLACDLLAFNCAFVYMATLRILRSERALVVRFNNTRPRVLFKTCTMESQTPPVTMNTTI